MIITTNMTEKVTVSAKVDRQTWKKIKEYGIDTSSTIRESLAQAIRNREMSELDRMVKAAQPIARKVGRKQWTEAIRRDRDSR